MSATTSTWLEHLEALAEALDTGGELPPRPAWMDVADEPDVAVVEPARTKLTLIRGGRE